jgi:2-haloacid dehalogenase
MGKRAVNTCLFSTYGAVLNIGAVVRRHAGRIGISFEHFTALWRSKQLEYALAQVMMRDRREFRALMEDALDYTLGIFGLNDPDLRQSLLTAHTRARAYKDVRIGLTGLRDAGYRIAIMSNEKRDTLMAALEFAEITDLIDDAFSVDDLGHYRPDPRGFDQVCRRLGETPGNIAYCTHAAWDAAGGTAYGFRSFWLNRTNSPAEYPYLEPVAEIHSILDLPSHLRLKPRRQVRQAGTGVAGPHESRTDQHSLCPEG